MSVSRRYYVGITSVRISVFSRIKTQRGAVITGLRFGGGMIPLKAHRPVDGRKPRLSPTGPKLIGGAKLIRGIQRPEMQLDLIARPGKHGRTTDRAEMPPLIGGRVAVNRDLSAGKNRRRIKHRPMMLATVQTMTETHAIRGPGGPKPHLAAEATAGDVRHDAPPLGLGRRVGEVGRGVDGM